MLVEVFALIALLIIGWMAWQLYRARQFNQFKQQISQQVKPLVVNHIKELLNETRCESFPNNSAHEQATIYYWCQYPSRLMQAALRWQLLEQNWLEKTGNIRNCQHLLFIERDKLADINEPTD